MVVGGGVEDPDVQRWSPAVQVGGDCADRGGISSTWCRVGTASGWGRAGVGLGSGRRRTEAGPPTPKHSAGVDLTVMPPPPPRTGDSATCGGTGRMQSSLSGIALSLEILDRKWLQQYLYLAS